jgi:hypothetical protein
MKQSQRMYTLMVIITVIVGMCTHTRIHQHNESHLLSMLLCKLSSISFFSFENDSGMGPSKKKANKIDKQFDNQ